MGSFELLEEKRKYRRIGFSKDDGIYCIVGRSNTAGKTITLLVTADSAFESNVEQMLAVFKGMLVCNKAHSAGKLLVCNCTTPDALGEEIRAHAIKFANQLHSENKGPYALMIPCDASK